MSKNDQPSRIRGPIVRGLDSQLAEGQSRVDRKRGIIYGVSVATVGEALGHGYELDGTTIDQIVSIGNAAPNGLKARFQHPNASGDATGKFLGRKRNFRREGNKAIADLHLSKSARRTPHGDLAGYVMDLAEDDPTAFGASIHIPRDGMQTEKRLNADNTPMRDADGNELLPLLRITKLRASDIVDEPAANPDGLFSEHRDHAAFVTQKLDVLFGDLPDDQVRERCLAFLDRYLSHREKDPSMTQANPEQRPGSEADQQLSAKEQELKEREAKLAADEAALKARQNRIEEEKKIRDTCLAAGSKHTDAYLQAGLSLSEVKDKLIEEMTKAHSLSALGEGGDDKEPPKPEDLFRKEYREQSAMLSAMGVSEEQYIKSRLIDGK